MKVHLDDAGIRRDFEHSEARIVRRSVAFEDDGRVELRGGVFDRGNEFEIFFEFRHRRHEDVESSVAWFVADRGAHNPCSGLAALWLTRGVFVKFAVRWRGALHIELTKFFALR